MADRQHKGLVARWLEGKERSEDYARSTLPTNRWSLFWDILKGRFGKLVLTNLIVLVTFLPIIGLFFWRYLTLMAQGAIGPYGSGLTIGYPAIPDITGVAEMTKVGSDLFFFGLLIPASAIAAIGISGGMYIIRNLIWTEGIFVANDFWRGVKRNYLNVLEAMLIFTVMLFLVRWVSNLCDFYQAIPEAENTWLLVMSKVIGIILLVLLTMMTLWMISLGVNYRQGPWSLVRNSLIMTIGTLPQTVFFGAIALLPFLLMTFGVTFLTVLGAIFAILISFSFAMLVWMDYSQWAFDKFVNPKLGVKTGRGIYSKQGADDPKPSKAETDAASDRAATDSAAMREYKRAILAHGKSRLVARPIRPIDDGVDLYQLPEAFTRDDLRKLRESREVMEDGVKQYAEEHKDDEEYVRYNKQFDELEKALSGEGKKGTKSKKKAVKRPKMLKKH